MVKGLNNYFWRYLKSLVPISFALLFAALVYQGGTTRVASAAILLTVSLVLLWGRQYLQSKKRPDFTELD